MEDVKSTEVTEAPTPALTDKQIAFAATNDPSLAPDEFMLGDRKFKVLFLPYDDYVSFISYLEPIVKTVAGRFGSGDLGTLDATSLVTSCAQALPEMVRIMCAQTDPYITSADVKRLGKTPFALAQIVYKQIKLNNMIQDIASFFGQILPFLKMARMMKEKIG